MARVIEQFQAFKNELLNNPRLTDPNDRERWVDPKSLKPSVLDMAVEAIAEDYGVTLAGDDTDYINFAGASLVWHVADEEFLYGGFKINGLWESLVVPSQFWKVDFSLPPDVEVPEHLAHFEKLGWFEKQAWGDDERFGCFIREPGTFPPHIAFFDRNWYVPMELSLPEYFEAMFASCAVKGWQYFYIDITKDTPHLDAALEDMERAVRLLPAIFGARDFSYHAERLRQVKARL